MNFSNEERVTVNQEKLFKLYPVKSEIYLTIPPLFSKERGPGVSFFSQGVSFCILAQRFHRMKKVILHSLRPHRYLALSAKDYTVTSPSKKLTSNGQRN